VNDAGAIVRISLIIGIAQLGFATIFPLLPLHLTEQLGASVKLVGVVVATFALVETFFKTALGGITDRYGRRPVMVAGPSWMWAAPETGGSRHFGNEWSQRRTLEERVGRPKSRLVVEMPRTIVRRPMI